MSVQAVSAAGLSAVLAFAVGCGGCGGLRAQDGTEEWVPPSARVPLGGPATVRDAGPGAFSFPARVLTRRERRAFAVGNAFFKDNWVAAPASAEGRDGLGPLFNARSCSSCHFKDGRGRPPRPGEVGVPGLLLRLGVRGADGGSDVPHPVYGGQLQDRGIVDGLAEGRVVIHETRVVGRFGDGTPYDLVAPRYEIADLAYGPVTEDLRLGPRVANQVIGLGLLESVPTAALVELADPDDADGDGISGRVHWVTRPGSGERAPGRFGWKATQATVRDQSAAAFQGDIGITSRLFPGETVTAEQAVAMGGVVSGGDPELDDHKLDRVAFYTLTLAVPAQRDAEDRDVLAGERLFEAIGCAECHVPVLRTGGPEVAVLPSYADVEFRAYTDLLLHDMGEGLADEKRDGDALPVEWRTPPLWGVGLFEAVNGHTRYLHDGRARNLQEAVLWHGGEAQRAKERFERLGEVERAALLRFLGSL